MQQQQQSTRDDAADRESIEKPENDLAVAPAVGSAATTTPSPTEIAPSQVDTDRAADSAGSRSGDATGCKKETDEEKSIDRKLTTALVPECASVGRPQISPPERIECGQFAAVANTEKVPYDTRAICLSTDALMYLGNALVIAMSKEKSVVFAKPPIVWIVMPQLGTKSGVLGQIEYVLSHKSVATVCAATGTALPSRAKERRDAGKNDEINRAERTSVEGSITPPNAGKDATSSATTDAVRDERDKVKVVRTETMPVSMSAKIAVVGKPINLTFSSMRVLYFAATTLEKTPRSRRKLTSNKFAMEDPNKDTASYFKDVVDRAIDDVRKYSGPEHHYVVVYNVVVKLEMPAAAQGTKVGLQAAVGYTCTAVKETYC